MNKNIEAVILANGEYPTADTPLRILHETPYVVCCDGGADRYIELGYTPDVIIGDGDSLSEENRKRYADIIEYNSDQETNDQTKAVEFLAAKGLRNIAIVGATGKCEDHTIGNIALLAEYQRMGIEIRSYTDYAATALAGVKSASITLAFNLFCSLITENSARTRNLFSPNILSNPKRPHECFFRCC